MNKDCEEVREFSLFEGIKETSEIRAAGSVSGAVSLRRQAAARSCKAELTMARSRNLFLVKWEYYEEG